MRSRPARFTAVAAVAALLALPVAPASATVDPLQPGDLHRTPVGQCTLNFVFDGLGANAGKVYVGTAAHCVSALGQSVRDIDDHVFGTVAYIGNAQFTVQDFAFIEVLPGDVDRVDPSVKGHPTYPTGVAQIGETAPGDLVALSGYGVVFGSTQLTQEQRLAVLTLSDANQHRVAGPLIFGDSGGPLVHVGTGKALGTVSRLCKLACTETGPTVAHIVTAAALGGFPVALRTV